MKNSKILAIINCKVKEEKQSRQPFLILEPLLPYIYGRVNVDGFDVAVWVQLPSRSKSWRTSDIKQQVSARNNSCLKLNSAPATGAVSNREKGGIGLIMELNPKGMTVKLEDLL